MRKDFTSRKRIIIGVVSLLVLADCGLAAYSWWQASAPRTPQQELDRESLQLKLLRGDIERAKGIELSMPVTQEDCDKFEKSLLPSNTGYSAVTEELGTIARNTGIQFSSKNFHQKDIANRKLTEVELDASISGNYASVVKFLNGLQRSANVYVVDSLALSTENQVQGSPSVLRLSLRMRTYFRTVA
jgi:type IV pilus assembly protein PilO